MTLYKHTLDDKTFKVIDRDKHSLILKDINSGDTRRCARMTLEEDTLYEEVEPLADNILTKILRS